jgi:hypothetical protein
MSVLRTRGSGPGSTAGAVGGSKAANSGWQVVPNEANLGSNRAKRTQFCPAGGDRQRRLCKTKPNLGRLGYVGQRRLSCGAWSGSETCETNPILAERPGMGAGSPGRDAPAESDCAKRTKFCPAGSRRRSKLCKTKPNLGGMGYVGRAVVVWGVAWPGSETCKTNPIWGRRPTIADREMPAGNDKQGQP